MTAPIVIIGSGMAGYAVAREFRKLNTETPLLMITADDGTSYSKPMLSTGFTKNKSAEELAMANAVAMSEQLNLSIRTQTVIDSIDTAAKTIMVDGAELVYDKLVLATGARVNTLPFIPEDSDKVCSINSLDDYRRFREHCAGKKRIAIIGNGLIGCEYANDLINGGFEIDLIGPTNEVLSALLPKVAADCVTSGLKDAGVTLHLEQNVIKLDETDTGVTLHFESGKTLNADLAISAIGLKPNIDLAQAADITVNQGIVCSRTLETSAPDVFAIGDCAEVDGHVLLYVLPLMASARALVQTLNGSVNEVSYGVMPVVVKTPACPVVVLPPLSNDGEWHTHCEGLNAKCEYKNAAGDLLGFALTGDYVKEKQALSKLAPAIHS